MNSNNLDILDFSNIQFKLVNPFFNNDVKIAFLRNFNIAPIAKEYINPRTFQVEINCATFNSNNIEQLLLLSLNQYLSTGSISLYQKHIKAFQDISEIELISKLKKFIQSVDAKFDLYVKSNQFLLKQLTERIKQGHIKVNELYRHNEIHNVVSILEQGQEAETQTAQNRFNLSGNNINPEWSVADYQLSFIYNKEQAFIGINAFGVGLGKAQPLWEMVLTPKGYQRMGNLSVGDEVITYSGKIAKILNIYDDVLPTYRIETSDGGVTHACQEHLWFTENINENLYQVKTKQRESFPPHSLPKSTLKTTQEIIDTIHLKHALPISLNLDFKNKLSIPPYYLGFLLALKGENKNERFSSEKKFFSNIPCSKAQFFFLEKNLNLDERYTKHYLAPLLLKSDNVIFSKITPSDLNNPIKDFLIEHNINNDCIFLPEIILNASFKDRLDVLRGILDAIGEVQNIGRGNKKQNIIRFKTTSLSFAKSVQKLCWGLRGNCSINPFVIDEKGIEKPTTLLTSDDYSIPENVSKYGISISLHKSITPFTNSQKLHSWRKDNIRYSPLRTVRSIEPIGVENVRCIEIDDNSHLYITSDYIVTHNTSTSLLTVQNTQNKALKNKTLFVVPNTVLSNFHKEAYLGKPELNIPSVLLSDEDAIFVGIKKQGGIKLEEELEEAKNEKYKKVFMSFETFFRLRLKQETLANYISHLQKFDKQFRSGVEQGTRKAQTLLSKIVRCGSVLQAGKSKNELFFEDFGFDSIVIDELHVYKNSKENLSNINAKYLSLPPSSITGVDAQIKTWLIRHLNYLKNKRHDGVIGLTATPITNSPLEIYAMLTLVAGEEYVHKALDIHSSTDFLELTCMLETELDYSVDGELKNFTIFKGIKNLNLIRPLLNKFITSLSHDDVKKDIVLPEKKEIVSDLSKNLLQQAKIKLYSQVFKTSQMLIFGGNPTSHQLAIVRDSYQYHRENELICSSAFNFIHKMDKLLLDEDADEQGLSFYFLKEDLADVDLARKTFNKLNLIENKIRPSKYTSDTDFKEIYSKEDEEKIASYDVTVRAKILPFLSDYEKVQNLSSAKKNYYLIEFAQFAFFHFLKQTSSPIVEKTKEVFRLLPNHFLDKLKDDIAQYETNDTLLTSANQREKYGETKIETIKKTYNLRTIEQLKYFFTLFQQYLSGNQSETYSFNEKENFYLYSQCFANLFCELIETEKYAELKETLFTSLSENFIRLFLDSEDYNIQERFFNHLPSTLKNKFLFLGSVKINDTLSDLYEELLENRGKDRFYAPIKKSKHLVFLDQLALFFKLKWLIAHYTPIPFKKIEYLTGRTNSSPEAVLSLQERFFDTSDNCLRLIIGNEKAQTSINLQNGTQSIHHLTIGWTQDASEQRNGRSWRQGNGTDFVNIFFKLIKGTFDNYKFNLVNHKKTWIDEVLKENGRDFVETINNLTPQQYRELISHLDLSDEELTDLNDSFIKENQRNWLNGKVEEQKNSLDLFLNAKEDISQSDLLLARKCLLKDEPTILFQTLPKSIQNKIGFSLFTSIQNIASLVQQLQQTNKKISIQLQKICSGISTSFYQKTFNENVLLKTTNDIKNSDSLLTVLDNIKSAYPTSHLPSLNNLFSFTLNLEKNEHISFLQLQDCQNALYHLLESDEHLSSFYLIHQKTNSTAQQQTDFAKLSYVLFDYLMQNKETVTHLLTNPILSKAYYFWAKLIFNNHFLVCEQENAEFNEQESEQFLQRFFTQNFNQEQSFETWQENFLKEEGFVAYVEKQYIPKRQLLIGFGCLELLIYAITNQANFLAQNYLLLSFTTFELEKYFAQYKQLYLYSPINFLIHVQKDSLAFKHKEIVNTPPFLESFSTLFNSLYLYNITYTQLIKTLSKDSAFNLEFINKFLNEIKKQKAFETLQYFLSQEVALHPLVIFTQQIFHLALKTHLCSTTSFFVDNDKTLAQILLFLTKYEHSINKDWLLYFLEELNNFQSLKTLALNQFKQQTEMIEKEIGLQNFLIEDKPLPLSLYHSGIKNQLIGINSPFDLAKIFGDNHTLFILNGHGSEIHLIQNQIAPLSNRRIGVKRLKDVISLKKQKLETLNDFEKNIDNFPSFTVFNNKDDYLFDKAFPYEYLKAVKDYYLDLSDKRKSKYFKSEVDFRIYFCETFADLLDKQRFCFIQLEQNSLYPCLVIEPKDNDYSYFPLPKSYLASEFEELLLQINKKGFYSEIEKNKKPTLSAFYLSHLKSAEKTYLTYYFELLKLYNLFMFTYKKGGIDQSRLSDYLKLPLSPLIIDGKEIILPSLKLKVFDFIKNKRKE